jgi:hypothetical protein
MGPEQAGAGGGPDECEGFEREGDGFGVHAGIDDEVDFEIFHRGVDVFFDGDGKAVDFVDEQDIVGLEFGESADQIGPLGEGGAGGDGEGGGHFVGDDVSESGFAQTGGAVEEDVLHRLIALLGGGEGDAEFFDEFALADVLDEGLGSKGEIDGFVGVGGGLGGGDDALFGHEVCFTTNEV